MKYFENSVDGVIVAVSTGLGREEISRERYEAVIDAIKNPPVPRYGYGHRLKTDLSWEEYPIDLPDPDPEIDDAEVYDILFGGAE